MPHYPARRSPFSQSEFEIQRDLEEEDAARGRAGDGEMAEKNFSEPQIIISFFPRVFLSPRLRVSIAPRLPDPRRSFILE